MKNWIELKLVKARAAFAASLWALTTYGPDQLHNKIWVLIDHLPYCLTQPFHACTTSLFEDSNIGYDNQPHFGCDDFIPEGKVVVGFIHSESYGVSCPYSSECSIL
ncbi:hypothetical protein CROQUDRAFT_666045 [Cronartium quercuum f. sp. fusiforme G11]|uniref:Uncharacterized protein n=1 Tax=Cronartium quercuum f. sp. fusiforme G11 TaxID=708437 RepID=A0A9P6N8L4_9BASI|nr:hypothetical protein CROQUDRAFT_666045 [Cronartium quercuum f. sp. fusiforme G11]